MMCIGWRKVEDCGRKEQVTTPAAATCPNISWFWAGLVAVVLVGVTGGKGTS